MNYKSKLFEGSTDHWGSRNTKQQLYWVLIVTAVLFVGVRGGRAVMSFCSTQHGTEAVASASENTIAEATQPAQSESPVVETARVETAFSPIDQVQTSAPRDGDETAQQAAPLSDRQLVDLLTGSGESAGDLSPTDASVGPTDRVAAESTSTRNDSAASADIVIDATTTTDVTVATDDRKPADDEVRARLESALEQLFGAATEEQTVTEAVENTALSTAAVLETIVEATTDTKADPTVATQADATASAPTEATAPAHIDPTSTPDVEQTPAATIEDTAQNANPAAEPVEQEGSVATPTDSAVDSTAQSASDPVASSTVVVQPETTAVSTVTADTETPPTNASDTASPAEASADEQALSQQTETESNASQADVVSQGDPQPSGSSDSATESSNEQSTDLPLRTPEVDSAGNESPAAETARDQQTVTTTEEKSRSAAVELVLVNPRDAEGAVRYLVNGYVYTMPPGHSQRLPGSRSWRVNFHRGGDFGNAEMVLRNGVYEFRVGNAGWDLWAVEDAADTQ